METKQTSTAVILHIPQNALLQDNDQWTNRFEIHSQSSNRVYTVAQNKKKRYWACSCPGWKRYRHCKHLINIGLPGNERPYEVRIEGRRT